MEMQTRKETRSSTDDLKSKTTELKPEENVFDAVQYNPPDDREGENATAWKCLPKMWQNLIAKTR